MREKGGGDIETNSMKRERRRSFSEFGAEKARVGHKGGECWIALYSPQLSAGLGRGRLGKRIFSRPESSHRKTRVYRTSATAMARPSMH